jgi:hypothetical protein
MSGFEYAALTTCKSCGMTVRYSSSSKATLSWMKCPCCGHPRGIMAAGSAVPNTSIGEQIANKSTSPPLPRSQNVRGSAKNPNRGESTPLPCSKMKKKQNNRGDEKNMGHTGFQQGTTI